MTYQGEPIRKLGREVNANIKLAPKEKSYRKVLTEASERDTGDDHDARISLKSHKWAVKVTSPQVKKIMLGDKSLLNPKLCFATNIGKIKRVKKSVIPVDKLRTETGVIIQRVH